MSTLKNQARSAWDSEIIPLNGAARVLTHDTGNARLSHAVDHHRIALASALHSHTEVGLGAVQKKENNGDDSYDDPVDLHFLVLPDIFFLAVHSDLLVPTVGLGRGTYGHEIQNKHEQCNGDPRHLHT